MVYMKERGGCRLLSIAAAVTMTVGTIWPAGAAALDVGNPDVTITWDNSLRYNLGRRVQERNDVIGNTASTNAGDYSFDKGDVVTNRLDLLSELQVDFKRQFGARASASAWYDAAFRKQVRTNPALATRGSYIDNEFSQYVKRYYGGPSGEILDAFVYGNFDLGSAAASVKAGRHAVLWGEAMFLSTHSVSYGQTPTDLRKLAATPGATAKETALPIGQVSGTLQVSPEFSVSGQYIYEWRPTRFAEGGTYLAATDFFLNGPDRFFFGPTASANGGTLKPPSGNDYGVSARWRPAGLDGTVGLYVRKYAEKSPWLQIVGTVYQFRYADNVNLVGLSLSKQFGGVSFGSELVYRTNAALASTNTDANGQGARGNTLHALANGVAVFGTNPLWSSSSLSAEVAYSRWTKVRLNEALFNTCDHGARAADTGCVTKDSWQAVLSFAPSWTAVAPGLDLSAAATVNYGIKGNGMFGGFGNEKAGSYGLSVTADYNTIHQFRLAYNGYLATYNSTNGTSISTSNGQQLQDRGWLAFTYSTAF
jgi:hypothetical protein